MPIIQQLLKSLWKDDGITTNQKLVDSLKKNGKNANTVYNWGELEEHINKMEQNNLCIVLMGAGNIYKWTEEIYKQTLKNV